MKKYSSTLRQLGPYLNIGGVLAGCIVIGALFGHWLDTELGTAPAFLLAGSLFGIGAGFYHFFKVVLRKPDESGPDDRNDDNSDGD